MLAAQSCKTFAENCVSCFVNAAMHQQLTPMFWLLNHLADFMQISNSSNLVIAGIHVVDGTRQWFHWFLIPLSARSSACTDLVTLGIDVTPLMVYTECQV